jgi:ABC-2 type transport system permease protein
VPLLPLAAAYLLLVPLMTVGRFLRNKNSLMIIGGIVGLVFALAFNLYIQSAMARLSDPAWILANFAGPDSILARIGSAYPPTYLAWKSLSSGGGLGALYALANLALGLAAAAAVVLALGPAYAASLLGFGEMRLRRLSDARSYIYKTLRRRSAFASSVLREVRMLNREPIYFMNGPMVVVLMPLIFGIMYIAQREQLNALLSQLGDFRGGPYAVLACAAFGSFLGTSMSIPSTALSRDAKVLPYLKALPLGYGSYMLAKLGHALLFSAFGVLVGACGGGLALGLTALDILGALLIALAFSTFMNAAGLWLDTANPRLSWDNPITAMKQNVNAVIAILGTMGFLGALGVLSTVLGLGKGGFVLVYGGIFAALSALAIAAFPRYAEKRIASLEV